MEELKQAGLTESEIKVYQALLDLGPSHAGQIARKSGLHRRTVYDTTEMLIRKGIIGYILQNNRRLFKAENPNRILEILKEKQNNLNPIISKLQEKYSKTVEKEETNFYKGKEGLKTVFEDQLTEKEIWIIGASENASEILNYYIEWYNKKRVEKKIKTRVIAYSKDLKKMKNTEMRFLPEKYSNQVAINIYGNKTAIILWASRPLAIVINNKEITEGYKKHFELMWKIAKE